MTQEHGTRRGVALYEQNPFLSGTAMQTKTRRVTNKRGDMMLVSASTGEIQAPIAGFWEAEEVEEQAAVYWGTLAIGGPTLLAEDEMDRILLRFKSYGQR